MKKFRFSLEAILLLREREEQRAVEKFMRASAAHRERLERLEDAERDFAKAAAELREKSARGIPGMELRQMQGHLGALEDLRKERARAAAESQAALGQARDELAAARRRKEVIDRFREKQRRKHAEAARLEELKFLDELAAGRAAMGATLQLKLEHSLN